MKFYHAGFSLIELMIVVSIIGILSMIAIPSYKNYTLRARFAEVISSTQIFKTAIALALQEGVPLSELNTGSPNMPPEPKRSKNLANIKIENGTITATATEIVKNNTYILKPNLDGSIWIISGTCVKNGLCSS
jgi:type IV pilus assembly protein PilA